MKLMLAVILALVATPAFAQPNVVLVILDDLTEDHYGFRGHPDARTPNLDRFAASGVTLPQSVLPCARCRPSLASLICGRRPEECGVYANVQSTTLYTSRTLPAELKAAGYRTRADGKWWEASPALYGFDEWGNFSTSYGDPNHIRTGQPATVEFVRSAVAAQEPFFLWWAPQLPHTPHDAPASYTSLFPSITVPAWFSGTGYADAQRKFLANLYRVDEAVGHLRGELRELGVLNDTLFVVVADNGYQVGRVSKNSPFWSGVGTPVIFSWPARFSARTECSRISTHDIAPTILSLAGITVPTEMTGADLTAVLDDMSEATAIQFGATYPSTATVDFETDAVSYFAHSQDGWHYVKWLKAVSPTQHYDMNEPVLAVVPTRSAGTEDLYYLPTDPKELTNLSGDPTHAAKLAELRDAAAIWWAALEELPPPDSPPPPPDSITIIDDGDAVFVGSWTQVTNPTTPGAFNDNLHYAPSGTGSVTATWSFTNLEPGDYEVYATWNAHPNRATNSPFSYAADGGAFTTVAVNQEQVPSGLVASGQNWTLLGQVATNGAITVGVTNAANEYVIADGVLVKKVD